MACYDIPGAYVEASLRYLQDQISVRFFPDQVFKAHVTANMAHNRFNRDGSPQHGLLFHFIIENFCCGTAGKMCQENEADYPHQADTDQDSDSPFYFF